MRAWTATRPRSWTSAGPPRIGRASSPQRTAAPAVSSATPAECPASQGEMRSAKSPIAARARSIASSVEGELPARLGGERGVPDGRALVVREDLRRPVGERGDDAGSNAPPARSRTTPTAASTPPIIRWNVASRATCTIRTESGISSPPSPFGSPLPSQRSVNAREQRLHRGREAEAQS